jgi:hypothetical protein
LVVFVVALTLDDDDDDAAADVTAAVVTIVAPSLMDKTLASTTLTTSVALAWTRSRWRAH